MTEQLDGHTAPNHATAPRDAGSSPVSPTTETPTNTDDSAPNAAERAFQEGDSRKSAPLTREERQVLADLELCSHGTTNSYQPVATKSGSGSRLPPAADAPHHEYKRRLLAEHDPQRRARILQDARDDLDHLTKRTAPRVEQTETAEQVTARIRRQLDDGWTVEEVARANRCTPTRVRQAAAAPSADADLAAAAKHARILELDARGHSTRSIGKQLRMSKSTVQRVLRRAA